MAVECQLLCNYWKFMLWPKLRPSVWRGNQGADSSTDGVLRLGGRSQVCNHWLECRRLPKESQTRDFRLFVNQFPPGPWVSNVSLLLAINYCRCRWHQRLRLIPDFHRHRRSPVATTMTYRQWNSSNNISLSTPQSKHEVKNH